MQANLRETQMIKLIHDCAENHAGRYDMIFTDPPFEMSGETIRSILSNFDFDHLVLICSAHQMLDFYNKSDLEFAWQMVFDFKTPTKNRSLKQPHIQHANIAYFRKQGVKSAFDRSRVVRQDHYSDEKNHYYPSIFHAPKSGMAYKYQKNQSMIDDLIGAFDVQTVCDPFAGSGTTGLACLEHQKDCTLIEVDDDAFAIMKSQFSLLGESRLQIIENEELSNE